MSQFKFFWSLTAESSLLPVAEEQAFFQIFGFRSESGCLATTDIVRIKTEVLDHLFRPQTGFNGSKITTVLELLHTYTNIRD